MKAKDAGRGTPYPKFDSSKAGVKDYPDQIDGVDIVYVLGWVLCPGFLVKAFALPNIRKIILPYSAIDVTFAKRKGGGHGGFYLEAIKLGATTTLSRQPLPLPMESSTKSPRRHAPISTSGAHASSSRKTARASSTMCATRSFPTRVLVACALVLTPVATAARTTRPRSFHSPRSDELAREHRGWALYRVLGPASW